MKGVTLAVALAAFVPAQSVQDTSGSEPARDLGFGTIRTLDGKPWIGAKVTLVHNAHDAVDDPRTIDRIEVLTDEQGRYRTQLLVGCAYTVSALGDADAKGRFRRTDILRGVVARRAVVLQEQEPGFIRYVRLDPHPSWDGKEALTVRAGTQVFGPHPASWWRESDQAFFATTPTPSGYGGFVVLVNGNRAHSASTRSAEDSSGRSQDDPIRFEIPERRVLRRRILGPDGSPVVGARTIFERSMGSKYAGTTSDSDGWIELVHASSSPDRDPYPDHIVIAEGLAEIDYDRVRNENEIHMQPGYAVVGRLTLGDEQVGRSPIVLDASMGDGSGTWFGVDSRSFETGPDGSFRILGRQDSYAYRLTAILDPDLRMRVSERLGAKDGRPLAPTAVLAVEARPKQKQGEQHLELGSIDLADLRPLDVDVTAEGGVPPGSVLVTAIPVIRARFAAVRGPLRVADWPHEPIRLRTGRRGRVRMLYRDTAPSTRWLLHVETAKGSGWTITDPRQGDRARIDIDPRTVVAFRLEDARGNPIEGARISVVVPEAIDGHDRESDVLSTFRDLASNAVFRRDSGQTGADGIATLVLPMIDGTFDMSLSGPGRTWDHRVDVEVAGERPAGPIVIEVPNR